jgi:hypothetical protein
MSWDVCASIHKARSEVPDEDEGDLISHNRLVEIGFLASHPIGNVINRGFLRFTFGCDKCCEHALNRWHAKQFGFGIAFPAAS